MFPNPGDWTNKRLVEECLGGNEQAWNILLDRYKNLIYSIPLRYGASPQDAADIFQAVCLDLFNELPRLREPEALQGWLIRVTTNKCYHWKRLQATRGEDSDTEGLELESRADLPPDVLAMLEREQMIREAIGQLPPRCRQMIELLFFEYPSARLLGSRAAAPPCQRLHRLHSWTVSQTAQAHPRGKGLLMGAPPISSLDAMVGQVALEPQKRKRHKLLQAGREWWNPAAVTRLYDEMVRLARVDLKQAERLADAALWIAEKLRDDSSRAVGLRAVGHVFFLKGNHPPRPGALPGRSEDL